MTAIGYVIRPRASDRRLSAHFDDDDFDRLFASINVPVHFAGRVFVKPVGLSGFPHDGLDRLA